LAGSIDLITIGASEDIVPTHTTGSAASGHPLADAFDFNPDTYFQPGSATSQLIDIDLGAVQSIDQCLVWLQNYALDWDSASLSLELKTDDNDNGSYSATTTQGSAYSLATGLGQELILPFEFDAVSKRYWRFMINRVSGSIMPNISLLALAKTHSIGISNQRPESNIFDYMNRAVVGYGGRVFPQGINRNASRRFMRRWVIHGTANMTAILNAYQDSRKNLFPLVLYENSTAYLVRIADMELLIEEVNYQHYEIELTFELVHSIAYGENY
jgi:hypothetical protein